MGADRKRKINDEYRVLMRSGLLNTILQMLGRKQFAFCAVIPRLFSRSTI